MKYELYELSKTNRNFINMVIERKKKDRNFILDNIQEFKFSVSIINGVMHQKITHCQKTNNYKKSYWLAEEHVFEGNVVVNLTK